MWEGEGRREEGERGEGDGRVARKDSQLRTDVKERDERGAKRKRSFRVYGTVARD